MTNTTETLGTLNASSKQISYEIEQLREKIRKLPTENSYEREEKEKKVKLCRGVIYLLKCFNIERNVMILPTGQRIRLSKIDFRYQSNIKKPTHSWGGVNFSLNIHLGAVTIFYSFDIPEERNNYGFEPDCMISNGLSGMLKYLSVSEIEQVAFFGVRPNIQVIEANKKRKEYQSRLNTLNEISSHVNKYKAYERNKTGLYSLVQGAGRLTNQELQRALSSYNCSLR